MISQEESLDTAFQAASQGGRAAFGLLRFAYMFKRQGFMGKQQAEVDQLMTDVCSKYRGGYCSPQNEQAAETILHDLTGGKTVEDPTFLFFGDRSDLSVFWEVVEPAKKGFMMKTPDVRVSVPRWMIENIPFEEIRKRTLETFAKAQADGLVSFDGVCYKITDKGRAYISRSDFILNRLEKEYEFFTRAEENIDISIKLLRGDVPKAGSGSPNVHRSAPTSKESWIDEQLRAVGKQPQRAGYYRVTIDIDTLDAQETSQGWSCFVPGTSRSQRVVIPDSDVVEINNGRTLVAFISPDKTYLGSDTMDQLTGIELMRYFDDRTEKRRRQPTADSVKRSVDMEFAAAKAPSDQKLSVGATVFAPDCFQTDMSPHMYTVSRVFQNKKDGQRLYMLSSQEKNIGNQVVPESFVDKLVFTDKASCERYISTHKSECDELANIVVACAMSSGNTVVNEPTRKSVPENTYLLKVKSTAIVGETDDSYIIRLKGEQVEQLVVPKGDVTKNGDMLEIALHDGKRYEIKSGNYSYSLSGAALASRTKAQKLDAPSRTQTQTQTPAETVVRVNKPSSNPVSDVNAPAQKSVPKNTYLKNTYLLKVKSTEIVSENEYRYIIRLKGERVDKIIVPKDDVTKNGDMLEIALHDGKRYEIKSGNYSYSLSGAALASRTKAQKLDAPSRTQTQTQTPAETVVRVNKSNPVCKVEQLDNGDHILTIDKALAYDHVTTYSIQSPDKRFIVSSVPSKDVKLDGKYAEVLLRKDTSYVTKTSTFAPTKMMTGNAVVGEFGKVSAKATATATTKTAGTVLAAVPTPEPISTVTKTIMAAGMKTVGEVGDAAQSVGQGISSLNRSITDGE